MARGAYFDPNVDPELLALLEEVGNTYGPYAVELFSGLAARDQNPGSFHPKGGAIDINLIDRTTKKALANIRDPVDRAGLPSLRQRGLQAGQPGDEAEAALGRLLQAAASGTRTGCTSMSAGPRTWLADRGRAVSPPMSWANLVTRLPVALEPSTSRWRPPGIRRSSAATPSPASRAKAPATTPPRARGPATPRRDATAPMAATKSWAAISALGRSST